MKRDDDPSLAKRPTMEDDLYQLAKLHGIQTSYIDMRGKECHADHDAIRALLRNFTPGIGTRRQILDSVHLELERRRERCLSPVMVAWRGQANQVEFHLTSKESNRRMKVSLTLESGETLKTGGAEAALRSASGSSPRGFSLQLPNLPSGYHEFRVEIMDEPPAVVPGPVAMIGYARQFQMGAALSTDEVMRELRAGEE